MTKKKPRMETKIKTPRPELKFHFHNPNTPEVFTQHLINVFYDVQLPRAKKAIDEALMVMVEAAHAASESEEKPPPETG